MAPAMLLAAILLGFVSTQGVVREVDDYTCPECRISVDSLVTLGDRDGPGMLESYFGHVRRDSRGRYFLTSSLPYFWVFSPDGQVVRRIGRDGEGPGEFRAASGVVIDGGDSIRVFDSRLRRMTVFSPDLRMVRTERLEFNAGIYSTALGNRMVVNSMVRTPDRIGYPLQLVDQRGEIIRSFGSVDGVYRADLRDALDVRKITPSLAGGIWSAWRNQYVIEHWDTAGALTDVLHREVEWFPTWWHPTRTGPNTPPVTLITAIQARGDTLWVLLRIADSEWWGANEMPEGRNFLSENPDQYLDTMVEVIDLKNATVIASQRMPQALRGFAGPGIVYGSGTDVKGNPVVPLWRVDLVRASSPTRRLQ